MRWCLGRFPLLFFSWGAQLLFFWLAESQLSQKMLCKASLIIIVSISKNQIQYFMVISVLLQSACVALACVAYALWLWNFTIKLWQWKKGWRSWICSFLKWSDLPDDQMNGCITLVIEQTVWSLALSAFALHYIIFLPYHSCLTGIIG